MKAKTLLIAAATLAAGIVATQAAVYSQNIVGYLSIPFGANKFVMVAPQMITGTDIAKTNCNIQAVLGTNGWYSTGDGSANTTAYVWSIATHKWLNVYYYTAADADNNFGQNFGDGWYDGAGGFAANILTPDQGVFIKDYSGVTHTNTFVGTVVQGTNVTAIGQGFQTFCLQQPIATNALAHFVGTSDPGGNDNTAYYHWNGNNGWDIYQYFTAADADNNFGQNFGDGWYNGVGSDVLSNHPEHWPKVGEAFFFHQPLNITLQFTNVFVNQ